MMLTFISMMLMILMMFAPSLMMSKLSILQEWLIMTTFFGSVSLPLIMDLYSMIMSLTVLLISLNVMLFSATYMKHELFITRFNALLFMFVLSMLMLIFIPHLMILLVGWDGLGLSSFLLVIFYPSKSSLSAGLITILTNRIGDATIILAISLLITNSTLSPFVKFSFSVIPAMLIYTAACTKSAQMPFSSWLPAAMAAPTPVSALVHSSTLVTAGIYLMLRFWPSLYKFQSLSSILFSLSIMTLIMASLNACMEMDMKKIIALSTLSQLGLMMLTLALNLPLLAFFHLITHAIFKSLLFIGAGSLIAFYSHSQEMREISNMPFYTSFLIPPMIISLMALAGTPFLSAFYSKESIIESSVWLSSGIMVSMAMTSAVLLTPLYSLRLASAIIISPAKTTPLFTLPTPLLSLTSASYFLSSMAMSLGFYLTWLMLPPHEIPSSLTLKLTPMGLLIISIMMFTYNFPQTKLIRHTLTSMWFLTNMTKSISSFKLHFDINLSSLEMLWISKTTLYPAPSLMMKMYSSLPKTSVLPISAMILFIPLLLMIYMCSLSLYKT
uniref:NADH-ubiquinone oxidoreductase chain 5 n=1 Tax=Diurodrilus subterraneus TaxID=1318637 RepID=M9WDX9_9ANNE|nr:NADH dehydrogenase subunit 5 [Diurodrilus subterraneus]